MKYILCGVAALCLAAPFLFNTPVLAPALSISDLIDGAAVTDVRYDVEGYEYRATFTNNLVLSVRADGSFDYHYLEGN